MSEDRHISLIFFKKTGLKAANDFLEGPEWDALKKNPDLKVAGVTLDVVEFDAIENLPEQYQGKISTSPSLMVMFKTYANTGAVYPTTSPMKAANIKSWTLAFSTKFASYIEVVVPQENIIVQEEDEEEKEEEAPAGNTTSWAVPVLAAGAGIAGVALVGVAVNEHMKRRNSKEPVLAFLKPGEEATNWDGETNSLISDSDI